MCQAYQQETATDAHHWQKSILSLHFKQQMTGQDEGKTRPSDDPDFEYILNYTKWIEIRVMTIHRIFDQLANLAISKNIAENDGGEKARCLRTRLLQL